jgi:2'-5' RNA ligase/GNAT superfamily N-acetyltransferase
LPRVRLGVVLLVPEPVAAEIDGLRRGLGDGTLGRIPAHLTLVPPVNVALDRVDEAGDVLRTAAAGCPAPLELTLGPAVTFWPVTPVIYLEVGGALSELHALRDRVFRDPLARPLTYDFVPHVTLADEVPVPERIDAAVRALADYARTVPFENLHLLREGPGRVWEPIAEVPLAPPRVVGRGGLPLELTVSSQPDLTVSARLRGPATVAVTARRQGRAVGVASALLTARAGAGPDAAWLLGVDVAVPARRTGVGARLVGELAAALRERGVEVLLVPAPGPSAAGFLERMGFGSRSAEVWARRV